MSRVRFHVRGMTCSSCALRVEKALLAVAGVQRVRVSLASSLATVDFDPDHGDIRKLREAISAAGYSADQGTPRSLAFSAAAAALLIAAFLLASYLGVFRTGHITVLSDAAGFPEQLVGSDQGAVSSPACPTGTPSSSQVDEGGPADCAAAVIRNDVQEAAIRVTDKGYFPAVIVLQKGIHARVVFDLESHAGSDTVVSIPEHRCRINLAAGRGRTPFLEVSRDFYFYNGTGVLHGAAKVVNDLGKADLSKIRRDMFSAHPFARPAAGARTWYGD